jgi:hypothetical protein
MKLIETVRSEVSARDAFRALCQSSVREQACRESGALNWAVQIEPRADGGVRVQIDRAMPPEVPDFAKRLVGSEIKVRQIEEWGPADGDGARTARVAIDIIGQPASMRGSASLRPEGSGAVETVEGEVKVAVPIIGRRFEPEIARVISAAVQLEMRLASEWARANPSAV